MNKLKEVFGSNHTDDTAQRRTSVGSNSSHARTGSGVAADRTSQGYDTTTAGRTAGDSESLGNTNKLNASKNAEAATLANNPAAHQPSLGGGPGAPTFTRDPNERVPDVGTTHSAGTGVGAGTTGLAGASSPTSRTSNSSMPAVGTGSGRYEETAGSSPRSVSGRTGDFSSPHSIGHDAAAAVTSKFDPASATHDHKHLQHVVHKDVRHVEVEEVSRQKEHERHVHHVQHHVQPVIDKVVQDEVIHENVVPRTKIVEQHVNTDEDRNVFKSLGQHFADKETHREKERTVVDLGETVHETVFHHVHHITQPLIQREVVDRHRIHTVIPVHHTTHEAPIIHKSSVHEPVHMADFLQGGGKLDSGILHHESGVLQNGECVRQVDGVGESLAEKLHLSKGTTANQQRADTHV